MNSCLHYQTMCAGQGRTGKRETREKKGPEHGIYLKIKRVTFKYRAVEIH